MNEKLTILFTSVGRRVELLQAFRCAAGGLGLQLTILGVDASRSAPAGLCVDEMIACPRIADPQYIPTLAAIARDRRVAAIIPTIDTDLQLLSESRDQLDAHGCKTMIADPRVIAICRDKVKTAEFLRASGIDTPALFTPRQIERGEVTFPCFIKPLDGSSSVAAHKVHDREELAFYFRRIERPLVQEFIDGAEYTLDVYVGLSGEPRCVVPRRRIATRGGEVSKGVTAKVPAVMSAAEQVVRALGKSLRGLVTLQCMVTPAGRIAMIEINPRFGGGAPLGIAAGADYPRWLLEELLGRTPSITPAGFRDGVAMLRYDWSVFTQLDQQGEFPGQPLSGFPDFP